MGHAGGKVSVDVTRYLSAPGASWVPIIFILSVSQHVHIMLGHHRTSVWRRTPDTESCTEYGETMGETRRRPERAERGRGLEGAYPSPGRGGRKSHLKQGHAHRSKESLARVKSRVLNLTRQALRDLFFSFLSFSVVRIKYGTHLDAHHTHTLYRRTTTQPTGMLTRNTQFWLRRARESGCSWGLRCPPGGACRTYPYRRPRRGSGWSLARWRA